MENKELIVVRVEANNCIEQGVAYDVPASQYDVAERAVEKALRCFAEWLPEDLSEPVPNLYEHVEDEFRISGVDFERRDCTEFTYAISGRCGCDCCEEFEEEDEDEAADAGYGTDLLIVDYVIDGDEDNVSHMIFEVNTEDLDAAKDAVDSAMAKWATQGAADDESNEDKVMKDQEELICEEFEKIDIPYEIRTYSTLTYHDKAERK